MGETKRRTRMEKRHQEEIERQKAITRDSVPYDAKKMKTGMPLGCDMILLLVVSALIVGAVWVIVRIAKGW